MKRKTSLGNIYLTCKMELYKWKIDIWNNGNLIWLFLCEGVIGYYGMAEASINYHMFVWSQNSRIKDHFIVYSWQRLNLSSLIRAKKVLTLIFTFESQLPCHTMEEESLKRFIYSFKCFCALDLHGLRIWTVPDSIHKLTYLKYLDLSGNDIEALPISFIRLLNLQTLKLWGCGKLKELPSDIQKLVSLKHFKTDGCYSLTHMPCGLGKLTSLQTLSIFVVRNLQLPPPSIMVD